MLSPQIVERFGRTYVVPPAMESGATSVDFAATLPRNPSGKILKRELREPNWKGRERRIN